MPSNSVTNSEPEDTFATIVEGGKVYGDRIAAWVKAKTEHDAAFAKLQVGRATKNMLEEAQAARDAAVKSVADAHAKADEVVAAAMTKADGLVQHGKDRLTAALADAAAANKEAADARASGARYLATTTAEANTRLAEANRLKDEHAQKVRELDAATAATKRAQAEAEAIKLEYIRKHKATVDFHKNLWG